MDNELLERVAAAMRQGVRGSFSRLQLQWSQAGTQHSGRLLLVRPEEATWLQVPDEATNAMAALRRNMATDTEGAWLLATISVDEAGEVSTDFEYERRPFWNSTRASMLEQMPYPVPTDQQWLHDLERFPRDRAHTPAWLNPREFRGEAKAEFLAAIASAGIARPTVVLPGDEPDTSFEGALEITRYGEGHYGLFVSDYGERVLLGEYASERDACLGAWHYLTAPLPPPARVSTAELAQRMAAAQDSLAALAARVRSAGEGGLFTSLATGLAYDRLGGLDGLFFFPWNTPFEQRSLPQTAWGPQASQIVLLGMQPVQVQAEIAPAWFDQPGGGLRFHVERPARSVRDLVATGVLQRVLVTEAGASRPT